MIELWEEVFSQCYPKLLLKKSAEGLYLVWKNKTVSFFCDALQASQMLAVSEKGIVSETYYQHTVALRTSATY